MSEVIYLFIYASCIYSLKYLCLLCDEGGTYFFPGVFIIGMFVVVLRDSVSLISLAERGGICRSKLALNPPRQYDVQTGEET